mmetsp:Transcript_57926/g.70821  ORF Transcript_57926/g.70821 Transcript_57926/m.70821 type:complete len:210 (+) Transcript_57926:676-1305(+)
MLSFGHCRHTHQVHEEANQTSENTLSKELEALELQNEGYQLKFIGLVDEKENDQKHTGTHAIHRQKRHNSEEQPDRILQISPESSVKWIDVISEERQATRAAFVILQVFILTSTINSHCKFPHDFLLNIWPYDINCSILCSLDLPGHFDVVCRGLEQARQAPYKPLQYSMQFSFQEALQQFLKVIRQFFHALFLLGSLLKDSFSSSRGM